MEGDGVIRWPHQIAGVAGVLAAESQIVVLTSPTGAGKTLMATDLIREYLSRGEGVSLYATRKALIDQIIKTVKEDGFDYSVRAAGHPLGDALLQISSLPTEKSRAMKRKKYPLYHCGLVLVDEGHMCKGPTDQAVYKEHLAQGAQIVMVTATPIDMGNICGIKPQLVVAGKNSEVRECGAIVPAKHYGPLEPDCRKVRKAVWEYTENDVRKIMMVQAIVGRVLDEYRRLNPEQKPTILFAPGVAESIWFADEFRKAGIRSAHIDGEDCWLDGEFYRSSTTMREEIFGGVRDGSIKVLCNRFCLDEQTEILTERGWVGIDEMKEDDLVANWNEGEVFFAEPRAVIRRDRQPGEAMVCLETPRRSVRVTEGHKMLFRTTNNGKFSKADARDIVGRSLQIPVSGEAAPLPVLVEQPRQASDISRRITSNAFAMRARGFDPGKSRDEAERRIRERDSLRYKQPHQLTLEECELIGFWIGDGNKNRLKSGGVEYRMWQGLYCPEITARVDWLLERIDVDVKKSVLKRKSSDRCVQWSLCRGTGYGSQKRRGVFHLEPYLNKEGTLLFWGLDRWQFDAVIKGLWMANGTSHRNCHELPKSRLMICGTRKCLFDVLQAVAVCRGYRASVRKYKQSKSDALLYMLTLSRQSVHRITKHKFFMEEEWKSERVWCVETDSGNIITRRNGSATVMGNCLREGINLRELQCCIFATIFSSLQAYIQSGGRNLRAFPGKEYATIIDFGGNYWRHGSLNSDRNWVLEYTDQMYQYERQERLRAKKCQICKAPCTGPVCANCGAKNEVEPFTCPKCHMVLVSRVCPCGFEVKRKTRPVMQADGRLVHHEGDIFRPRQTDRRHDTEKLWESCYWRCKKAKKALTFAQAEALFAHENGYWPPHDLPYMPTDQFTWMHPVAETGYDKLIPKEKTQ